MHTLRLLETMQQIIDISQHVRKIEREGEREKAIKERERKREGGGG